MNATNDGLRKRCRCGRRTWAKCPHPWYVNSFWQGQPYRFSLDKLLRRHVDSKTDAITEADALRDAIKAGTFNEATWYQHRRPTTATIDSARSLTLRQYGPVFLVGCPKRKGKYEGQSRLAAPGAPITDDQARLNQLYDAPGVHGPLGDMDINLITEADLELALQVRGTSASTRNKYLQLCRLLSAWGVKKKLITRSWFEPDTDIRRRSERKDVRKRRLHLAVIDQDGTIIQASEEDRLIRHADERLQRLIIAALESCARQGELIELQWAQIERDWIRLDAEDTKDGEHRYVPITSRLRAVLAMVRFDPAGRPFPPSAYVFGNEVGERLPFPKKAWETTLLRAHGITPEWERGQGKLTAACRTRLTTEIDLEFRDLRREGACRLHFEQRWPLGAVQALLGHANIETTSRYLNIEREDMRQAMRRAQEEAANAARFAQNLHKKAELHRQSASPVKGGRRAKPLTH
jgi:integrase